MKKIYWALCVAAALTACAKGGANDPDLKGKNDGPNHELSIDEQKDYFSNTVSSVLSYLHPAEQQHAIEIADFFAEQFAEYDWDFSAMEEFYEDQYSVLWEEPRYVSNMMKMKASASANPIYTFSFANDAMTFEANTSTRVVKCLGKSSDGKYTLRLRDGNNTYLAQVWKEGKETSYTIRYDEFDSDDNRSVKGVLPEKIHFVFKENNTELISGMSEQSIEKDDHINFNVNIAVTTMSVRMIEKMSAAALEFFYSVKNNDDVLIAMNANIPSLPVLVKKGNLTYEEWVERYADRWETIVREAGDAEFTLNIGDRIQFKGKGTDGGRLYKDLMNLFDKDLSEKKMWGQFSDIINEHAEVAMYFNSNVKQGEVKMDVVRQDDYYMPMPLLFFKDGSSYDFSSYFMDEKVYESYIRQVNSLLSSYERMFKYLDVDFRI